MSAYDSPMYCELEEAASISRQRMAEAIEKARREAAELEAHEAEIDRIVANGTLWLPRSLRLRPITRRLDKIISLLTRTKDIPPWGSA